MGRGGAGAAAVGEAEGAAAPARHSATYAFSVMPLAWKLALSALHSSMQAFAVFCWLTLGALVVGAGAGLGAEGAAVVVTVPVRHCATYAFSVMPFAWKLALSALHSSMQAFAVFCWPSLGALAVGAGAGLGAEGAAVVVTVPVRH